MAAWSAIEKQSFCSTSLAMKGFGEQWNQKPT